MMLVKYWAKVCKVTGNPNMFTTYSLVMLVVFCLQQVSPPILPSIAMLQQLADPEVKAFERGWECTYCDKVSLVQEHCPSARNTATLKQLLTEFFRFYNSYDYEHVICPLLGRPVQLEIFEDVEILPPEMKLYEENKKIDSKNRFQKDSSIRTQDPFELCSNITRSVPPSIYLMFRNACELSLDICENTPDELLLEKLFSLKIKPIKGLRARGAYQGPPPEISEKIHIEYKKSPNKRPAERELLEWYKLTTEAVFLVMREIFKTDVKMKHFQKYRKVQKTEAKQDVHTLQHSEDSVYICTGQLEAWRGRKKDIKLLNRVYGNSLTPFEKEVCLSNILYRGLGIDKSFNLVISSYDNFKQNCRGIDLSIHVNNNLTWTKAMRVFISKNLERLVTEASNYLQKHGEVTKQLLKAIVDGMREKFEARAEEEDPEIIVRKKRISKLEKQRAVKRETGCKPIVLNTSVGNNMSNVSNMTPSTPCSFSDKQRVSNISGWKTSFNSYSQGNSHNSPSYYNMNPQFRFPYNMRRFFDYCRDPPQQRSCDQQFSAYPERHGHNYNVGSMSWPSSLYPYNKRYRDDYW